MSAKYSAAGLHDGERRMSLREHIRRRCPDRIEGEEGARDLVGGFGDLAGMDRSDDAQLRQFHLKKMKKMEEVR